MEGACAAASVRLMDEDVRCVAAVALSTLFCAMVGVGLLRDRWQN
jgi:hypothetical protein